MEHRESVITDKNDYLNITLFGCIQRIRKLEEFKSLLIIYRSGHLKQNKLSELRSEINQSVTLIEEYVATSYTPVTIGYKFPGSMDHIQVVMYRELFNPRFETLFQNAIDHLDMAIGRYKSVRIKSFMNTVSPFYWIKCFSFWISCSLADILGMAPSSKKFSLMNLIIQIVTFFAAVAGIYGGLVTYFGKSRFWFG